MLNSVAKKLAAYWVKDTPLQAAWNQAEKEYYLNPLVKADEYTVIPDLVLTDHMWRIRKSLKQDIKKSEHNA